MTTGWKIFIIVAFIATICWSASLWIEQKDPDENYIEYLPIQGKIFDDTTCCKQPADTISKK